MRVIILGVMLTGVGAACPSPGRAAQDDNMKAAIKLLEEAQGAYQKGKHTEAIALAQKAAKLDAKNPAAPFVIGSAHLALRHNDDAIKAFTTLIELEPMTAIAYDRRGDAYLKEAASSRNPSRISTSSWRCGRSRRFDHWRACIALYYAGRFKDGVDQFEKLHRKVNPEDVETRHGTICNARANTPKSARGPDPGLEGQPRADEGSARTLRGKIKPQDVLDAAEKAKLKDEDLKEARFYANLYVGLFYESEGDAKKALEHLTTAAEKYKIGHYMWDVADVHSRLLERGPAK
jgi:lipoprotein NlpI